MGIESITDDYSKGSVLCLHEHDPKQTDVAPFEADLTESYHGIRNFIVHSDFSVTRPRMELVLANSKFVRGVASKDVTIDEAIGLWARLYVPEGIRSADKKLPVVLYFHGGGFVCLSVHSRMIHEYCESVCTSQNVIVLSVEYRKAPDFRIPTQYEDAMRGLRFLQSQARFAASNAAHCCGGEESSKEVEPWLASFGDFDRVFCMGDSAGGNLVHHLCVKAAAEDVRPLRIRGQILVQPGVGGPTRTRSELNWAFEKAISLRAIDLFWKLALPVDAERSHWACHVFPRLAELAKAGVALPETLLVVGGRDPLQDWQQLFYETQSRSCTRIKLLKFEEAVHGFNMNPRNEFTGPFLLEVGKFINGLGSES